MEEDIKILEEFKNITFLYGKLAITQEAHKSVSIAIENLIKGYREKEESEKYLYDAYQDAGKKMFEYAEQLEDSVPKSKIRDKVERLEDKVHILRSDATKGEMMMEFKTEGAINILYELLEDI